MKAKVKPPPRPKEYWIALARNKKRADQERPAFKKSDPK